MLLKVEADKSTIASVQVDVLHDVTAFIVYQGIRRTTAACTQVICPVSSPLRTATERFENETVHTFDDFFTDNAACKLKFEAAEPFRAERTKT